MKSEVNPLTRTVAPPTSAPNDGAVEWAIFDNNQAVVDDMYTITGKFEGNLIKNSISFTVLSTSKPGGVNDLCSDGLDAWHVNDGKCFTSIPEGLLFLL
jgi:hypothetical protein